VRRHPCGDRPGIARGWCPRGHRGHDVARSAAGRGDDADDRHGDNDDSDSGGYGSDGDNGNDGKTGDHHVGCESARAGPYVVADSGTIGPRHDATDAGERRSRQHLARTHHRVG
jgi:hypothetical protein